MQIEARALDRDAAHDLMKACVVPRPIAWVSTLGDNGVANAAPYSCFTFVAIQPPMLGVSVERRGNEKKDTLKNIEHTGDFVVNVVPEALAEQMNTTADDYPPEVNEILTVGLTPEACRQVRSPRIAECPISLECRLVQTLELGVAKHAFVIGEVVVFHVRDGLVRHGQIDPELFRPVGRLGGNRYMRLGETFELDRPWLRQKESTG